jgi:DNA invertase Pin-like site-specific DNA recombinase
MKLGVMKLMIRERTIARSRQRVELAARTGWTVLPLRSRDRLARSTSDLYRVVSQLAEKGVEFKALDDPANTSSRTAKLVMGILALNAEFENDIRHER